MARVFDALTPELCGWMEDQPLFFVATAPLTADGHVNLSPKGYDCFRVLTPTTVAYLDLTGSGAETIAHLGENGRITLLFCAFSGPPRILRLFGRGRAILADQPGFDEAVAPFPLLPGARSVIEVRLDRIATSCGYGIPLMDHVGSRDRLLDWAEAKGDAGIRDYWLEKNTASIDGLPAVVPDT